jgi:hypothetical protein
MNYRHLTLTCQCGGKPDHIREVGFTDNHELVIHWWCAACSRVVCVAKPLSDCWRDCPSPDSRLDAQLLKLDGAANYGDEDVRFLKSMGVRAF